MLSPLPRRNEWVHVSLTSPSISAFPSLRQGRLPHDSFRGLLSVHSRYGPHIRGMAKPPFTPEASAASLPPRLLQLLPAGAKVAGWDLRPLKDRALARRTLTKSVYPAPPDIQTGVLTYPAPDSPRWTEPPLRCLRGRAAPARCSSCRAPLGNVRLRCGFGLRFCARRVAWVW